MRKGLVVVSFAAWLSLAQAQTGSGAKYPPARDANFAMTSPGQFAWETFVRLCWPAVPGQRGVADQKKQIGAPVATVWETFKNVGDMYLPKGAQPLPWSDMNEFPPRSGYTPAKPVGVDSTLVHFLSENRMIDGQQIVTKEASASGPTITNEIVRYDVKDNQASFNYVVSNNLFNLDGQEAALNNPKFTFNFPTDAMEIKASWRILGPKDDASRYWTANAAYNVNGKWTTIKVGLTGLHFTSKILPNWFWATFEQVDNPSTTFFYFLGNAGKPMGTNPTINPAAGPLNDQFHKQLTGTKWAFYNLIGWQTDFVDANGKPSLLASTQMESNFEGQSSCITCHSMANIGPPAMFRLTFWDGSGGNLKGRTGKVNFQQIAQQLAPGKTFKQMDFVWSMRQAQAKVSAAPAAAAKKSTPKK